MGQCTDVMQTELKSLPDYATISKNYDAIGLIKAMKSITFSFRDQKNEQASVWRAYKALFNCYMHESDSPHDHLDHITNQVEILEGMAIKIAEN